MSPFRLAFPATSSRRKTTAATQEEAVSNWNRLRILYMKRLFPKERQRKKSKNSKTTTTKSEKIMDGNFNFSIFFHHFKETLLMFLQITSSASRLECQSYPQALRGEFIWLILCYPVFLGASPKKLFFRGISQVSVVIKVSSRIRRSR